MSELFPLDQVSKDSPRLRWIKKHNIFLTHVPYDLADWMAFDEKDWEPWFATFNKPYDPQSEDWDVIFSTGKTEDDALVNLAKRNGLKLWAEESL